ncbi:MAG: alpha/beta fold hydrolase [Actinomycetota bacterium]|nr:alpha/beta fold hydrolase [Actinomycetota bacterium]
MPPAALGARPRLPAPRVLRAADGVRISAVHEPAAPGRGDRRDLALVVAHGFVGSWHRPPVRAVASRLRAYGGVLSFDFRGHGRSGGRSTLGDLEVLDLDAVVRWARELGYARVATVGFSMGAAVVVRQAGLSRGEQADGAGVDAVVVAVSGPSHWYYRGTPAMRRLHRVVSLPSGRLLLQARFRARLDARHWDEARPQTWAPTPAELAGRIAPVPLLVVHGDRDVWFPLEHAQALYAAAREPKELWVEPGFGHSASDAAPELVDRIGTWAAAVRRVDVGARSAGGG